MAHGAAVRDRKKEAFWRHHVRAQAAGGQAVRTYCRAHGLTEPAFYWWRAELARRDRETPTPAFVPMVVPQTGADGDQHIVIELRGGRVLRLPMQMPVAQVTAWVRAVEAVS